MAFATAREWRTHIPREGLRIAVVEGTLSREEPCALNRGRTILTRFALGGPGLGHVKDALVADALEDRHSLATVLPY